MVRHMIALARSSPGMQGEMAVNDSESGLSLLHVAVICGDHDVLQALLQFGVSPNDVTSEGQLPLGLAAARGNGPMCAALLRAGADPCAHSRRGLTAEVEARRGGFRDLAEALLVCTERHASREQAMGGLGSGGGAVDGDGEDSGLAVLQELRRVHGEWQAAVDAVEQTGSPADHGDDPIPGNSSTTETPSR